MIVYLDTNSVIYFVERNPAWYVKIASRLAASRAASDDWGVSDLTRAEALVVPDRNGDAVLEAAFDSFFTDSAVTVFPITRAVCERAARLRAAHPPFKLPDALHLAVAIEGGCGLFLTADARLARCPDIAVEVLA
ncbi:MAG: type II toxin-antitoxin system VapC family toxin [Gemmataceae bacterium]